jgi:hypothetical protein
VKGGHSQMSVSLRANLGRLIYCVSAAAVSSMAAECAAHLSPAPVDFRLGFEGHTL